MTESSANETQIGGSHYKGAALEHWDFTVRALGNRYLEGAITKYISRWRRKDGLKDLMKCDHFLQKLGEEIVHCRVYPLPHVGSTERIRMVELFNASYDLPSEEAGIVFVAATWTKLGHIQEARAILSGIIQRSEAAVASNLEQVLIAEAPLDSTTALTDSPEGAAAVTTATKEEAVEDPERTL